MRKRLSLRGKHMRMLLPALLFFLQMTAQPTFPVNGVADPKSNSFAFTNATIVKDGQSTIANATLVVKDGKIVAVGTSIAIPKDAVVTDCKGKYIYPSFIDIYSDYGIAAPVRERGGFNFGGPAQITSIKKAHLAGTRLYTVMWMRLKYLLQMIPKLRHCVMQVLVPCLFTRKMVSPAEPAYWQHSPVKKKTLLS